MSDQTNAIDDQNQSGVFEPLRAIRRDDMPNNSSRVPGLIEMAAISASTVGAQHLWVAHITVSPGVGISPVHHHGASEAVLCILRGQLTFFYGEGLRQRIDVKAGEFVFIPSFAIHAVASLDSESAEMLEIRSTTEPTMFPIPDLHVPQELLRSRV